MLEYTLVLFFHTSIGRVVNPETQSTVAVLGTRARVATNKLTTEHNGCYKSGDANIWYLQSVVLNTLYICQCYEIFQCHFYQHLTFYLMTYWILC